MKRRDILFIAITFFLLHGARPAPDPQNKIPRIIPYAGITVLVDNMAGGGPVLGEWGLSYLIKTDKHQILFDAGGGKTLKGNADALGVDLSKSDAIVISHGHPDHTGGLDKALNMTGKVNLFIHPEAFSTSYWKDGSSAVPYKMSLSIEEITPRVKEIIKTTSPVEISDGIFVTGGIPRRNDFEDTGLKGIAFKDAEMRVPDQVPDDQAIFFRVPEGLVVVLGCAHAGVVNTMDYISHVMGEEKIYAVIGGSHLIGASPERLEKTIEALKKYDVQKVMLSHCTGIKAFSALNAALPNRCTWAASGNKIIFGTPQ
ncbi:MAG TPA: MBL fold metallo-hydrolase [Ignavibacteriales bacterium]|nr:MBL fold metallo-hydrolase [Ignavibacteriales bacterium]